MNFKGRVASLLRRVHKTLDEDVKSSEQEPKEQISKTKENKMPVTSSADYEDIKISDDVFFMVISQSVLEVAGVVGMAGDLSDDVAELIGKDNADKGIKIDAEGKLLNITVCLEVEYGINIPELALNVQSNVKHNVQELTGYEVQCVDVHVEKIVKKEDEQLVVPEEKE